MHVHAFATADGLTKGGAPDGPSYFYRVVADDSVQGTGQAKYAVEKLNADKATVFDAQEPYSVGLANTVERYSSGGTLQCSGCRLRTRRPTSRAS